jgi:hypothetical protein
MAELAAAFGTSHSVMLCATEDEWLRFAETDPRMPYFDAEARPTTYAELLEHAPRAAASQATEAELRRRFRLVQEAISRLKREIAAAKLDALIIVGDDQHELFQDQHMPAIALYYGATIRNAAQPAAMPDDWYKRAQLRRSEEGAPVDYPCHRDLAVHLIERLVDGEFDVSAVASLGEDQSEGHAYSFVHRWYLADLKLPVVPVFLNTYYPPNTPLPRRCVKFGLALKVLIEAFPQPLRVGLIASGGLSHFVCDEALDRAVIEAMRTKDLEALSRLDPRRLKAGSSEIRNWLIVAAAASGLDLAWISYTPVYRTSAATGIGLAFARWS